MDAVPASRRRATFVILCASVASYAILQALVWPALPTLARHFHCSRAAATWALTANLLAGAIATPLLGRYGDIHGKRRIFLVAMGTFVVGSLLGALAPSLAVLILARAIQGVGGAVIPLAFGLIRDEFPVAELGGAVGLMSAVGSAASGVAIVLSGPIVDGLGFHWLFWIPLIATSLASVAAFVVIPESPTRSTGRVNVGNAVLLSVWLIALLVAVSKAPAWGWSSFSVVGLLAIAVAFIPLWVVAEARSGSPLVDMQMMRRRPVWSTNLAAFLLGMGYYAVIPFIPSFVQTPRSAGYGFGVSIVESGFMVLPLAVLMFVFGAFTGRLAARFGSRSIAVAGMAIGGLPLFSLGYANTHQIQIYLAMAVMGAGFGLAWCALAGLIVAAVPPTQTGVASGMHANIRTIGGAIGTAVAASFIAVASKPNGLPAESGYRNTFIFLGGATLVGLAACLLVPRQHQSRGSRTESLVAVPPADFAGAAEVGR